MACGTLAPANLGLQAAVANYPVLLGHGLTVLRLRAAGLLLVTWHPHFFLMSGTSDSALVTPAVMTLSTPSPHPQCMLKVLVKQRLRNC